MPDETREFEAVLDVPRVTAVAYDPARDHLDVWVSQKLALHALSNEELVSTNLPADYDGTHDVHDAGMDDDRDGFDPIGALDGHPPLTDGAPEAAARQSRVRPVTSGVSEIHAGSTAATGGVLAEVTDPSVATWGADIDAGDLVRISNHHVYGHPLNDCPVDGSQPVVQPSPYDGGSNDDVVGTVAGRARLADGVTVDAAARRVSTHDGAGHHALPDATRTVQRDDYAGLTGVTLMKGGRTTGYTEADVTATDASVRVDYGGDTGVVTLRHQLMTGDLSRGGDSGSPVFTKAGGVCVGHLFAGSANTTVINRAAAIERELGVQLMPNENESLTADVQIQMESPDLALVRADAQSNPRAGESVTLRVTLDSNYKERVYVEATGPEGSARTEIPASALDEQSDGGYRAFTEVDVTAPSAYTESFPVSLVGGHVLG